MPKERPYRKFKGLIKFNINKLIKWSLMGLPFIIAAIIILLAIYISGNTYKLVGATCGAFTFLNVLHTITYFFEPKYYAKRRKKYLPMWFICGVIGLLSGLILFIIYHNVAIYFVGPLLAISLIGGYIKIVYTKKKYLIDLEYKADDFD